MSPALSAPLDSTFPSMDSTNCVERTLSISNSLRKDMVTGGTSLYTRSSTLDELSCGISDFRSPKNIACDESNANYTPTFSSPNSRDLTGSGRSGSLNSLPSSRSMAQSIPQCHKSHDHGKLRQIQGTGTSASDSCCNFKDSSATNSVTCSTSSANMSGNRRESGLSGLVCNVYDTTGKRPRSLVGATTTVVGDELYVFGGRSLSRSRPVLTSDMYVLDLINRRWKKLRCQGDIPSARYFHSMCGLGDTKLVCYGGMSSISSIQRESASGSRKEGNGAKGNAIRDSFTEVTVMSDIHIFDIPSLTWIKIETVDAPQGRYAHCAAILPSSTVFTDGRPSNVPVAAPSTHESNHVGCNGNNGSDKSSNKLRRKEDKPEPIKPVTNGDSGLGGNELIIIGGQDASNNYIEQISVFNLRSFRWTSTHFMDKSYGAYRSIVCPISVELISQLGSRIRRDTELSAASSFGFGNALASTSTASSCSASTTSSSSSSSCTSSSTSSSSLEPSKPSPEFHASYQLDPEKRSSSSSCSSSTLFPISKVNQDSDSTKDVPSPFPQLNVNPISASTPPSPPVSLTSTAGEAAIVTAFVDSTTLDGRCSGSGMLIYSNYNFLNVKLELQVRLPDGRTVEWKPMGNHSPPGLRFPNGGIIADHFIVCGTFLTSSKQEFSIWALDLRSLTWSRIDAMSGTIFSKSSWNRGILWPKRNTFIIMGDCQRNLIDDYNHRRINFKNVCFIELEAFGLYDNPLRFQLTSPIGGLSSSRPRESLIGSFNPTPAESSSLSNPQQLPKHNVFSHAPRFDLLEPSTQVNLEQIREFLHSVSTTCPSRVTRRNFFENRTMSQEAKRLGQTLLSFSQFSDMELIALNGEKLYVNSRILSVRWGPYFNKLLQDAMHESFHASPVPPPKSPLELRQKGALSNNFPHVQDKGGIRYTHLHGGSSCSSGPSNPKMSHSFSTTAPRHNYNGTTVQSLLSSKSPPLPPPPPPPPPPPSALASSSSHHRSHSLSQSTNNSTSETRDFRDTVNGFVGFWKSRNASVASSNATNHGYQAPSHGHSLSHSSIISHVNSNRLTLQSSTPHISALRAMPSPCAVPLSMGQLDASKSPAMKMNVSMYGNPVFLPPRRLRKLYMPHSINTLEALVYFFYTSSLPPLHSALNTPQVLCSLLLLARPYQIDGLLELVIEQLHAMLDLRNTPCIFNAAALASGSGDSTVKYSPWGSVLGDSVVVDAKEDTQGATSSSSNISCLDDNTLNKVKCDENGNPSVTTRNKSQSISMGSKLLTPAQAHAQARSRVKFGSLQESSHRQKLGHTRSHSDGLTVNPGSHRQSEQILMSGVQRPDSTSLNANTSEKKVMAPASISESAGRLINRPNVSLRSLIGLKINTTMKDEANSNNNGTPNTENGPKTALSRVELTPTSTTHSKPESRSITSTPTLNSRSGTGHSVSRNASTSSAISFSSSSSSSSLDSDSESDDTGTITISAASSPLVNSLSHNKIQKLVYPPRDLNPLVGLQKRGLRGLVESRRGRGSSATHPAPPPQQCPVPGKANSISAPCAPQPPGTRDRDLASDFGFHGKPQHHVQVRNALGTEFFAPISADSCKVETTT